MSCWRLIRTLIFVALFLLLLGSGMIFSTRHQHVAHESHDHITGHHRHPHISHEHESLPHHHSTHHHHEFRHTFSIKSGWHVHFTVLSWRFTLWDKAAQLVQTVSRLRDKDSRTNFYSSPRYGPIREGVLLPDFRVHSDTGLLLLTIQASSKWLNVISINRLFMPCIHISGIDRAAPPAPPPRIS